MNDLAHPLKVYNHHLKKRNDMLQELTAFVIPEKISYIDTPESTVYYAKQQLFKEWEILHAVKHAIDNGLLDKKHIVIRESQLNGIMMMTDLYTLNIDKNKYTRVIYHRLQADLNIHRYIDLRQLTYHDFTDIQHIGKIKASRIRDAIFEFRHIFYTHGQTEYPSDRFQAKNSDRYYKAITMPIKTTPTEALDNFIFGINKGLIAPNKKFIIYLPYDWHILYGKCGNPKIKDGLDN